MDTNPNSAGPPPPPPAPPMIPTGPPQPPPIPGSLNKAVLKNTPGSKTAYKSATISPAALKGLKSNEVFEISSEEMVQTAIKRFINFNQEYGSCKKEVTNHPSQPQLQDGPQCGLVALSMASKLFPTEYHVTPNQLFEHAKEKGFTKLGEMFSARNMLEMCDTFLPGSSILCQVDCLNATFQMCQDFLDGNMYLVPYDCDFSHAPCLAAGKKAHWALITGFILLSYGNTVENGFTFIKEKKISPEYLENKQVKLFGRQSKSLVLGIWNIDELITSNKNLTTMDDKRNPDDYIIPAEGIEASLANQIIKIKIGGKKEIIS